VVLPSAFFILGIQLNRFFLKPAAPFLFLFLVVLSLAGCSNDESLTGIPTQSNVNGHWTPLMENDTLAPYINLEGFIHFLDSRFEITVLDSADAGTFQVWTFSDYARDSAHVFYPIDVNCVALEAGTICYPRIYVVKGADPVHFRYLGNGYGTDGNSVYLHGLKVEGSKGEDF
jgi:hypothetical protein